MHPTTIAICALFAGSGFALYVDWLCRRERGFLGMTSLSAPARLLKAIAVFLVTLLLFGLFRWASVDLRCLDIPEVQPSGSGQNWRLLYHLTLIGLLIVATAVDFDNYTIPDEITVPGMLIGVIGACLICEVQICHLWVDWWYARPQLRGPFIPTWYDTHRFWHALAWSLAGLVTGGALTWLSRLVSSRVLGQEAMGLGDVTLMAMIGSFLGWQAVTLVFLIAPIAGLTIGILIRMISGKTYLPYGPWLSIAAAIVLFGWSHLWPITRLVFSDWLSVITLGLIGSVSFVALLWLIQLYKSIPTTRNKESQTPTV